MIVRILMICVMTFIGIGSVSAQKHYTMKVPNDSVPGQVDTYDVYIPIPTDFKDFFLKKFYDYRNSRRGVLRPDGKMKVSFIVDENGNLLQPEVIHNEIAQYTPLIESLIESNVPMIPGTVNGKNAKFICILELDYHSEKLEFYWTPILRDMANESI